LGWVESLRQQLAGNAAGEVVLELVGALGLSLVGKSGSDSLEVLVDLGTDLGRGEGFGKEAAEVVDKVLLLFEFEAADGGEVLARGELLSGAWHLADLEA
jgi:hypothetical protein